MSLPRCAGASHSITGRGLVSRVAALLLGLCGALTAAQAQAPAGDDETALNGAPFVLRAQGQCLEVNEPQRALDGARAQLGRCDGRPGQAWRRDRARLVNLASGRCLEVHGPDAGLDGARIQLGNCSEAPHQQWRFERGQLIARVDGRCLEAVGLDAVRPVPTAQAWSCNGEAAQRWRALALPPPAVRTVEAGPLFSNADADRKCPAVCRPGRWNGQWMTTVPGRMSVCHCVTEPVVAPTPAPPAPNAPPAAADPQQPMPPERFDELLRLLGDEAFPANALRTLQTVAADHRFSVGQVQRLFKLFPFTSDRLRAMEITLPRLVDRANAYLLLGEFSFEMDRAEARKLLERAPR